MRVSVCRGRYGGRLDRRLHAGHRSGHADRMSGCSGQGSELADEGEDGRLHQEQTEWRPSPCSVVDWVSKNEIKCYCTFKRFPHLFNIIASKMKYYFTDLDSLFLLFKHPS
jgi:hypothetical protein